MQDTTSTQSAEQEDFMATALKRFDAARTGWHDIREAAKIDMRAVNVKGGQWDPGVKAAREAAGRPALECNELQLYVQRVVNQARKDRPQPKVSPGDDDATEEAATFLEGRLRHIQYASQADVAYDGAVEGATTGGFGFYKITKEYSDSGARNGKPTMNQEPRIKRILDPMAEYPDPACMEPDFSDARYWFSRQWKDRKAFRKEFGVEPISFDGDSSEDWSKEDQVCIAEYWHVEEDSRRFVALRDGRQDYADELGEFDEEAVLNEREVIQRKVICSLIDGEKVLQEDPWEGQWIPRIPVLGRETVVDGKRLLIGIVRFAVDSQKLKNAYKSGIADSIQSATLAPWIGVKGTFKDPRWKDAHVRKYAYVEYEPVTINGSLAPAPTRNTYEVPIQALAAAALQETDDIKRAVGYSDAISSPSKDKLSGVAVMRRTDQADLTNFHFEDNLVRSQWHCARVVMDLDIALADTPRVLKHRHEDGTTKSQAVTMPDEDGNLQSVKGHPDNETLRIDIGRYDVAVVSGPSYTTKIEEELDRLISILQTDPQAFPVYLDVVFKLMGYPELEERAKLTLPPQIQQAMAAKNGNADPAMMQQQLAASQAQVQQMQQVLQQLQMVVKTKQIEGQNKLQAINAQGQIDIEKHKLQVVSDILSQQQQHAHEAVTQQVGQHFGAAKHALDLLHSTGTAAANMDQSQQQSEMAQESALQSGKE
jgi:hypothetical protein